ncbi:MAG: L-seryl-tRNA(Sec) selenium transferase, partial [Candidatus Nealsonbacteria bacterium]|nr:L-seryl-tRNA(Sec) selenium transferase [Candidatus Nealsonbacteria bacterium]
MVDKISHNVVVTTVRTVLDETRQELQNAASERTMPSASDLAERIAQRIAESEVPTLRPVINATGILLHTGLGRSPLAEEAIEAIGDVARDYASV